MLERQWRKAGGECRQKEKKGKTAETKLLILKIVTEKEVRLRNVRRDEGKDDFEVERNGFLNLLVWRKRRR